VVAGGGAGGCAVAARAVRALGEGNVAVIEPAQVYIYNYTIIIKFIIINMFKYIDNVKSYFLKFKQQI
jgi:NADPH-dependent 2,4-dienoyl-CoA reductase/sulfur reductase-like enzyme